VAGGIIQPAAVLRLRSDAAPGIGTEVGAACCDDAASGLPNSALAKHYHLRDILGSGNFATVRLGESRASHELVAVKVIEKKRFGVWSTEFSYQGLLNECDILRSMSHPHIVKVFDVFDEPEAFSIVLELVQGGDLFDYAVGRGPHPFAETDARVLFVQLLEAILYMHSRDIVHRDLKPENILVNVDASVASKLPSGASKQANAPRVPVTAVTLKITDFGLAKFCKEHEAMTTMCGTPSYLAPEVLAPGQKDARRALGYSKAVDIWSLGVILYILLSGTPPKNPHQGIVFNKYFSGIGAAARNLITQMLNPDPTQRADAQRIVEHPWLAGVHIVGRELAKRKPAEALDPAVAASTLLATESTFVDAPPPARATKAAPTSTGGPRGCAAPPPRGDDSPRIPARPRDVGGTETDHESDGDSERDEVERRTGPVQEPGEPGARTCGLASIQDYRISFEGMFQFRLSDSARQRPVARCILRRHWGG